MLHNVHARKREGVQLTDFKDLTYRDKRLVKTLIRRALKAEPEQVSRYLRLVNYQMETLKPSPLIDKYNFEKSHT